MISEKTKKNIKKNTSKVILNVPNEIDATYKQLAENEE